MEQLPHAPSNALEANIGSNEHETDLYRRESVLGLVSNLLSQLNPTLDSVRIDELLFSSGDILARPYEELVKEIAQKESGVRELTGWKDALGIAYVYWNRSDQFVPQQVIIADDFRNVNSQRESDKKALLYINHDSNDSNKRNVLPPGKHTIIFPDELRRPVKKEKIPIPDVYIAELRGECIDKHSTTIIMSGIDTMIIGGTVDADLMQFKIENDLVMFPDGKVGDTHLEDRHAVVQFDVGGNITQYGGIMAASNIKASNYWQYGGEIVRASNAPKGSLNKIILSGTYTRSGGEPVDQLKVRIESINYHDIVAERMRVIAAKEGLVQPEEQIPEGIGTTETLLPEAQEFSEAELADIFDKHIPEKRILRKNQDGSSLEIRTYILKKDIAGEYAALLTDAIAAEWSESNHNPAVFDAGYSKQIAVVILQKSFPSPQED